MYKYVMLKYDIIEENLFRGEIGTIKEIDEVYYYVEFATMFGPKTIKLTSSDIIDL